MKNRQGFQNSILIILCCSLLIACKKGDDSGVPSAPGNNNNTTGISKVPAAFTQKVLVEQFTGAWSGGCPDGIYRMDQLINNNNNKVIGVNIHMGDAMEIPLFNSYIATFNNNSMPQFPSAMVNRIPSLGNVILTKTQWASNVTVDLNHAATCGLAIKSSISANTANIEVHSGFKNTLSGTYHLTVFLIEDNVTGTGSSYDQVNTNNSNDPNSPYYNKPTPIIGFIHNNVVRNILTADLGDAIDPAHITAGGEDIKSFSMNINGKDASKLYIVAFINKIGTNSTTHEIMNVQIASLNTIKNWD